MGTGYLTPLATRIEAQLRLPYVAAVTGLSSVVWGDITVSHIFHGFSSLIGARNRGRLPFIEYDVTDSFTLENREGGTVMQSIRLLVHVSGSAPDSIEKSSMLIALAAISSIRSEATDNLTAAGAGDTIGEFVQTPYGGYRKVTMQVEQTFDRSSYGV
jgi:hypothetical protein